MLLGSFLQITGLITLAMNPCPCGWAGDSSCRCHCSAESIRRYRARISGPLLDRIDLHLQVPRLAPSELRGDAAIGESSAQVRERVMRARTRQLQRAGKANAHLGQTETLRDCVLSAADSDLLEQAMERLQLSARSMHRILRVARTVADLAGELGIQRLHLTEAIGYRQLDRGVVGEGG